MLVCLFLFILLYFIFDFFRNKNLFYFIHIYFFFFFFDYCFKNFLEGAVLKKTYVFFFIKFIFFNFFFFFIRYSSFFKLNTILDVFAVDKIAKIELSYCFLSLNLNYRLFIKVFTFFFLSVYSVSSIFFSTGWLEREIFDMFGVFFYLHEDLKRILSDYGFLGFPLRKIFPLVGFVECRFDDALKNILWGPITLWQSFRNFAFFNFWSN